MKNIETNLLDKLIYKETSVMLTWARIKGVWVNDSNEVCCLVVYTSDNTFRTIKLNSEWQLQEAK